MSEPENKESQQTQDAPPPAPAASAKEVDDLKKRVSGQDTLIRKMLEATGANSPDDLINRKPDVPKKEPDKPKEDEPDEEAPDKADKKYWTDDGAFLEDAFRADTIRHEVHKAHEEEASEDEDDILAETLQALPARYRKDDEAIAKNLRMLRLIAWERNGAKAVRRKDAKAAAAELVERDQRLVEAALEEADKAAADRRKGEMPETEQSQPAGVLKLSIPVEAEKDRTKRAEAFVDAYRKQKVGTP